MKTFFQKTNSHNWSFIILLFQSLTRFRCKSNDKNEANISVPFITKVRADLQYFTKSTKIWK